MSLAVWADLAAIASTILAAGATGFAGWEVYKSRMERRQDLRFMYAQKAGELRERIFLLESRLADIDYRLSHRSRSAESDLLAIAYFRKNLQILKTHEILHEASVVAAIGKGLCFDESPNLIVRYFSTLDKLYKEMSFAESLYDHPERGDGRPKIAYEKDAIDFARNDYDNIQNDYSSLVQKPISDEVVSMQLLNYFSESIKVAYI